MQPSRACVGLEWVCLGDARVHVSSFADLRPGQRPHVTCPECGDRVTPALGKIQRHHARHRAGVVCAATHLETALHINTKYYLADVLARAIGTGASLMIRRRCIVGNRPYVTGGEASWIESRADTCGQFDDSVLVANWDAVQVESRIADQIGHRVPDIVLLENGRWVGAIEVFVSHEVDAAKAVVFGRLEVPWVEVVATDALCDRSTGWTIGQPLEPRTCSVSMAWRCQAHHALAAVPHSRPLAVSEPPPNRPTLRAARIVDVYFANGTWQRLLYRVRAAHAAGALVRLALDRDGHLIERYPARPGETESAFTARVNRPIRQDCEADITQLSRQAAVIDRGRWLKGDALSVLDNVHGIRRRFRFNHSDRQWERDTSTAKQSALQRIETAIRGRRSEPQRALRPRED
jgi:hypothetical protein